MRADIEPGTLRPLTATRARRAEVSRLELVEEIIGQWRIEVVGDRQTASVLPEHPPLAFRDRGDPGDGHPGAGDDDFLAARHPLEEAQQVDLRFVHTYRDPDPEMNQIGDLVNWARSGPGSDLGAVSRSCDSAAAAGSIRSGR